MNYNILGKCSYFFLKKNFIFIFCHLKSFFLDKMFVFLKKKKKLIKTSMILPHPALHRSLQEILRLCVFLAFEQFHLVLFLKFLLWIIPICCWGHKLPFVSFLNFFFYPLRYGEVPLQIVPMTTCTSDHGNTMLF